MLTKEELFHKENIKLAFFRVRCWTERISKDQVGLRAFGEGLEKNCSVLSQKLIEGSWVPSRGFKFYVPKSSGTQRTKTLLFVEDAIVYQAIANKLAEDNYDQFNENHEFVYGSVLSPEVKKGVGLLNEEAPDHFFFLHWGALYKKFLDSVKTSIETDNSKFRFETDITGFFDSIPHYNLLALLSERYSVSDEILDLLSDCFNLWSGTKDSMTPGVGIPQGPAPSYFFANLLLHDLDDLIINKGFKYYRYMDDIKIYWYNKEELNRALVLIDNYLKGKGLSLNSKKTSIEELTIEKKESSIKELEKKMFTNEISFSEFDLENTYQENDVINELLKNSNDIDSLLDLNDQDRLQLIESITDQGDIVITWEEEIKDVTNSLQNSFKDPSVDLEQLEFKEEVTDNDIIGLSFRFFGAHRALKELGERVELDEGLIKFWLYAYETYFWRASSFGLTLSLYGSNKKIKEVLERIALEDVPIYEWVQYHAIMQLSLSHRFTDKELREVYFRFLTQEESAMVRLALYRLIFRHGEKTLISALKKNLQKEAEHYIKLLVADFNKKFASKEIDMVEFIEFIGI